MSNENEGHPDIWEVARAYGQLSRVKNLGHFRAEIGVIRRGPRGSG